MMPYQSYRQWEIERTHTVAEQRGADRRRGEAAAAVSGSLRSVRRLRLRWQRLPAPYLPGGTTPRTPRATQVLPGGTTPRTPRATQVDCHVHARAHARAAACNTEV